MKFPIIACTPVLTSALSGLDAAREGCVGHTAPRHVIRGESPQDNTPSSCHESQQESATFIDYIAFSYKGDLSPKERFPLYTVITKLFGIPSSSLIKSKSGRNGYTNCVVFTGLGYLAYGGSSQKNTIYVVISGNGCKLIPSWKAVYDWSTKHPVKITRLDIAFDDPSGELVNVQSAMKWYDLGLFNTGGRPPKRHLRDDFNDGSGKTFYVGKRGNSKLLRVYEKGKEQGDPISPWCRAEIEFLAKDQRISWNAVINPDPYFSGAYTALSHLISSSESSFERIKREENIALQKATEWCRTTCGQFINLLCRIESEDYAAVIKLLRRDGIPKKLQPYFNSLMSGTEDAAN